MQDAPREAITDDVSLAGSGSQGHDSVADGSDRGSSLPAQGSQADRQSLDFRQTQTADGRAGW